MRLGLLSQVRRRWAPVGIKLTQAQQMRFVWRWLSVAVDVASGDLVWLWQDNLKASSVEQSVSFFGQSGVTALVWDNAPSHKARVVRQAGAEAGVVLVSLPPCSPELNPAERLFEEVRRRVEGYLWADIEAKVGAVESYLEELAADSERVRRLCGWDWISTALAALPVPP